MPSLLSREPAMNLLLFRSRKTTATVFSVHSPSSTRCFSLMISNSVFSLTTLGASILPSYKGGVRGVRRPVQVRAQVWSTFQPGAFCSVHSDCTRLKQTMAKYQKKTSLEVPIFLPGQAIRLRHVSPIKMKSYHVGSLGSGHLFPRQCISHALCHLIRAMALWVSYDRQPILKIRKLRLTVYSH